MFKKLIPSLAAISLGLGSVQAIADSICAPEKLAKAVDTFASEPYGAATWRMLNGLGQPEIDTSSVDYVNWHSNENWTKRVAALAPNLQGLADPGYDCRMVYPLQVLNSRALSIGTKSPYVEQWIKSQTVVIAACNGTANASQELPPAISDLPADEATMQTEDRAYQIASIAFYKDKPKAIELFRQIAASNSSHKAYARYNVANLLANNKDVNGARVEATAILADQSLAPVHEITQELLGYISNIEDTPAGWTVLIDHTLAVLAKPKAEIMSSETLKTAYGRALDDVNYAGITAKQDDWWVRGELPKNPTLSKAIMNEARKSPMANWMMTGQSVNSEYRNASWAMIGDKWSGWAESYVDRAEALVPQTPGLAKSVLDVLKTNPTDQSRAALWAQAKAASDAAAKSCGEAPETGAAGQLLLHAVRLSATSGKFEEVYAGLAAIPFKGADSYTNGVVAKLAQYVLAMGNVEEGRRVRDRLLTPEFFNAVPEDKREQLHHNYSDFLGWVAEDESHWKDAIQTSSSKLGNPLLNLLPAKKLAELASDTRFSADQKSLLLRAAWTRNFAQGKKIDEKLTDEMLAANPQIKGTLDDISKTMPKLSDDKKWLLTILRNPRFGILLNSPDSYGDPMETPNPIFTALDEYDHNDKNWWCPLEPGRHISAVRQAYNIAAGHSLHDNNGKPSPYDKILFEKMADDREVALKQHPIIKSLNAAEIANLEKMASAPRNLTTAAIAWGKTSKGDDGAPEALALAVQATHYGCNWHGGHKAYSKPAQELLKTKFATSQWFKVTPYWFDCMEMVYDKNYNKVATCKSHEWPKETLPK